MHSLAPVVGFVLSAALMATPLVLSAADPYTAAAIPISSHELNFSPGFAGHPGDLSLLNGPPPASPPRQVSSFADERAQVVPVSTPELDQARTKLEQAKDLLKKLQAEKDAALVRKKELDEARRAKRKATESKITELEQQLERLKASGVDDSQLFKPREPIPVGLKLTDPVDARLPVATPPAPHPTPPPADSNPKP